MACLGGGGLSTDRGLLGAGDFCTAFTVSAEEGSFPSPLLPELESWSLTGLEGGGGLLIAAGAGLGFSGASFWSCDAVLLEGLGGGGLPSTSIEG